MTEDETVGWHHRLNGHEFQQTAEMVKDGEAWRAAVHGVQRARSLEKTLMLGKIEGRRRG